MIEERENPIKLILCVPRLAGGGAERVIVNLANNLDKKKFSISIVTLKNNLSEKENLHGIKIFETEKRLRNSILEIRKILIKEKPDIIMTTAHLFNPVMAMILFTMRKRPLAIMRETKVLHNMGRLKRRIYSAVFRKVFSLFIAQSHDMASDMKSILGLPEQRIAVIHNPVDIGLIDKLKFVGSSGFDKSKINIVWLGRFEKVKRPEIVLEIAGILRQENYIFHLLGEGSLYTQVKQTVDEHGLSNVTLWGYVQNPYPFIHEGDAIILTSSQEGFPNVLLEGLCLGKPVFSFLINGGINEIIEDGINGFAVKDNMITELADKICEVKKFAGKAEAISSIARKKYGPDIIREYESLFFDLLNSNS